MFEQNKITYSVIAVIVLLAGAIYFLNRGDVVNQNTNTEEQSSQITENNNQEGNIMGNNTSIINNKVMISQEAIKTEGVPANIGGAIISTNLGDIEVTFNDKTPNTVTNFISLVATKFYDGVRFHRVIKGFMIQTGDPLSKDLANKGIWGTGGPGYKFADELTGNEKYPQGTLAMANSGKNTNGSQFFIVTASPSAMLNPDYTVFGSVVNGMDVALKIENSKTDSSDRPIEDVIIKSITLK